MSGEPRYGPSLLMKLILDKSPDVNHAHSLSALDSQKYRFSNEMNKMEDLYNQNKDKWVTEIVNRCIK